MRRLREDAGLSLEEAAPRLDWSTSKLGRIETAQQGVDVHGVRSMLDLYGVGGAQWTEIIDMVREAKQKGWWHAYGQSNAGYPALKTDAAVVYDYQLGYVPGLLQTADYARAVFRGTPPPRTGAEIDRIVQARLFRQRRRTEDPPLELVVIVDETVATPRTPPGPSWRSPTPSGEPSSTASRPVSLTEPLSAAARRCRASRALC